MVYSEVRNNTVPSERGKKKCVWVGGGVEERLGGGGEFVVCKLARSGIRRDSLALS
jgi:hypothetical protein